MHEAVWVDEGACTDVEAEQDGEVGPEPPSDTGSLSEGEVEHLYRTDESFRQSLHNSGWCDAEPDAECDQGDADDAASSSTQEC